MIYITAKGKKVDFASNDVASISVSLHNPNHNGDKFKYIIEWVNEQPFFTRCQVDLSDTLYRHNYMMTNKALNEMQAYLKARRNGSEWIEKHKVYLDKLNIPYEIIRWDKWLDHPEFNDLVLVFKDYYRTDFNFKEAVDAQVYSFFARKDISKEEVPSRALQHSADFLLEELACHTIMYNETPAVKIYPGSLPVCYKYVKEYGVPGLDEPLKGLTFARLIYHGVHKEEKSDLLRQGADTKAA